MPRNIKVKTDAHKSKKEQKNEEKALPKAEDTFNSFPSSDFPNLSKIDDEEDCEKPIEIKAPGIPVQLAVDCDLSQKFVRLEKLASQRTKIKDKIETKSKNKDDLDQEILALENEVKEKEQRIKEEWKVINERDEQISKVFEELEEERLTATRKLTTLKQLKMYSIDKAFHPDENLLVLTGRIGTKPYICHLVRRGEGKVQTAETERKEITEKEARSLIKEMETDAKEILKEIPKMASSFKKERKENNVRKADNANLEKELKDTVAICSEMKKRRKKEQKQIKREQLLLKEIEEEMEKEKNVILRAHNVC